MAVDTHASGEGFEESLVSTVLEAALSLPRPTPVLAIAGLQGSGKSTLAAQVAGLAEKRGLRVAVLSLDDFYLGREQRRRLAREVHPLLATRGPPGTHDLGLALETMENLRAGRATRLPRFDKLADDRLPAARWPTSEQRCDFVLLEGWFLKTPPQDSSDLIQPLNALERDEDSDGSWRQWCNAALADDYPRLWRTIDALWFLQGPGFELVPEWRWQQEQMLQAAEPARAAMTRAQIGRFVQFFERVSRQALRTLPAIAERTVRLDARRRFLR
jgi:D-glycerate 3-kinase